MNNKNKASIDFNTHRLCGWFRILYQTWGGNPESKLNKTALLDNPQKTNNSFDSILGTTGLTKNDSSSSRSFVYYRE